MDDTFMSRLRENFEWLRRDSDASGTLKAGLLSSLAGELSLRDPVPTPEDALAMLDALGISDAESTAALSLLLFREKKDGQHETVPSHISYMRSQASDRAFRIFSEHYENMSVSYGTDFKSICEDVYDKRADACILPLESTDSGLLMSFRSLVLKYELSIFAACRVRQNDDSLLTLALLTPERHVIGDIAEFYLPSVPLGSLETLSKVAEVFGTSLLRASTVASEYPGEYNIHACALIPTHMTSAFDFCLETLYPSYTPLGNYSLLNNGKE